MKIFAFWKHSEGTVWYGPEPSVVSSAGAGSQRKEVKLIEGRRSNEDAAEGFRSSCQERKQSMVSKEVRQVATVTLGTSSSRTRT